MKNADVWHLLSPLKSRIEKATDDGPPAGPVPRILLSSGCSQKEGVKLSVRWMESIQHCHVVFPERLC
ncbi:unnamed protein product [Enterobius vermicularis]|uniref:Uncharacterized protein n=1 Tax=Enterobius vermicularis TaxID=51028 RepID=A0A0N4V257_ENTVE|nr:unnamed protein product [Enterobius vermicularis]